MRRASSKVTFNTRKPKSDYVLDPIEQEDVTKKWVVTCFGMLSYRILSEHDTKAEALTELRFIQAKEHRMQAAAKGYTRNPLKHDFDVRTVADLEALTRAILETYR